MKARIESSGNIVEVENLYDDGTALVKGRYFKVSDRISAKAANRI